MEQRQAIITNCKELLEAYHKGKLGQTRMPEEAHPNFGKMSKEERYSYFTFPMALNYQRDSYKLWEAALATYNDNETKTVFDTKAVAKLPVGELRKMLLKHRLAMQPNKHIHTWKTIAQTITEKYSTLSGLFEAADNDFLKLKEIIQIKEKKGFPYLSGPKIFNYWAFIIQKYGGAKLSNSEWIEIAPDTHVTSCSVKLGVLTQEDAEKVPKEVLSAKWRKVLDGSGITPIEMHPPLWFWSRNGFEYKLKK